jgi:hypothetical protein
MQALRQRPDGTFTNGDESYRLEEAEHDHFSIRRLRDDHIVGELRFVGGHCQTQLAEDIGARERDTLSGLGELLEEPRGILPLQ